MDQKTMKEIEAAYERECNEFPAFANEWGRDDQGVYRSVIQQVNELVAEMRKDRYLPATLVLKKKFAEIIIAISTRDAGNIHDSVIGMMAVLMRVLDVIEDRARFDVAEDGGAAEDGE